MKKTAYLAFAALALLACQREVEIPQEETIPTYTVTLTAGIAADETKTAYDAEGKFSWVAGDQIGVLVTNGTSKRQVAFTTAEAGAVAQFTGEVPEGFTVADVAGYALAFDTEKNAWTFPGEVTVNPESPLSGIPLFGFKDVNDFFQFKTASGILKFTVENMPAQTRFVSVETFGEGAPTLCGTLETVPETGVVAMNSFADAGNALVYAFTPAQANETYSCYFFVPAGTLPAEKAKFCLLDESKSVIQEFPFKKDVAVAANTVTNIAPIKLEPVFNLRQMDSLALVNIFNASHPEKWPKPEVAWDLTKPMNEWKGVVLTDGRVTSLKFGSATTGVLTEEWSMPADLCDLTALTELRVVKCALAGDILPYVYKLPNLKILYLTNNKVTSTLTDEIGNLTGLTDLYIDQNETITGTLPATLGQLKNLVNINISKTGISGAIPAEMANCSALKNFMAFSAGLSSFEDNWDQWPALEIIMLYGNPGLEGPLPESISRCKAIKTIRFDDCNFTGNIPASYANIPVKQGSNTTQLWLKGNKLSGVVPAAVQAHENWQATKAWKYETNILPQQEGYGLLLEAPLSRQTDSLALVAIFNAADGANWKASRKWDLEKPMPDWPGVKLNEGGRVIEMSITNGTVSTVEWEIPAELAQLTELQTLQIVGSKLKGEIPEFLYNMINLSKIRLNTNNLTGALSEKLGQLTELTELYINGNKEFGGTIPQSIGQLTKLESINIAQTAIGGEIPQSLSQCTALKNFMAYSNKLSGEIPDFWEQLPNVGVLQLYGNPDITGPIPASIGTLKKATGIQLKECNLTGNIPASFGGLEKCGNLQLNDNKLSGVVPAEVQAHPKWLVDSGWKYEINILPQQEGYGLTLE
jgi:Leucine-rich repeat (LRR) protein